VTLDSLFAHLAQLEDIRNRLDVEPWNRLLWEMDEAREFADEAVTWLEPVKIRDADIPFAPDPQTLIFPSVSSDELGAEVVQD
jgi:hypothetical protein